MRRHAELPIALFVFGDLVAAAAATLCAYLLRFETNWIPVPGRIDVLPPYYREALPFVLVLLLIPPALLGMYSRRALGRTVRVGDGLKVGGVAVAILGASALFYRDAFQYSRITILLTGLLYGPAFWCARVGSRVVIARLRRHGRFQTHVALIGWGRPAARLVKLLEATEWTGLRVVCKYAPDQSGPSLPTAEALASLDDVVKRVDEGQIDEVFVAIPAGNADFLSRVLQRFEQGTCNLVVVPDLGDATLVHSHATVVSGLPLIYVRERPMYGARAAAKRMFDLSLAVVLLILSAPVLLLIALLVRVSSAGPVLFRQERMGIDGRAFRILKFRTMCVDAEAETGPTFATAGDPRTTWPGRFLRRFSLDELPQLVNVLRGEMSLVGPRPERAPFIEEFRARIPGYMLRHSVRAGMTGWAQVHGLRGNTSMEERLRYDLEYIDRWSLMLDLEILGRTAVQVMIGANAY